MSAKRATKLLRKPFFGMPPLPLSLGILRKVRNAASSTRDRKKERKGGRAGGRVCAHVPCSRPEKRFLEKILRQKLERIPKFWDLLSTDLL